MGALLQDKAAGGHRIDRPRADFPGTPRGVHGNMRQLGNVQELHGAPAQVRPHAHVAPVGESQAVARRRAGPPFPLLLHAGQALDSLSQPGQGHIHRGRVGRHVIQMVPGETQLGKLLLGVRQALINNAAMEIGPEQAHVQHQHGHIRGNAQLARLQDVVPVPQPLMQPPLRLFREKRWSCPALFSIQYRCSSLQSWLDRTDCQGWLQDSVR